MRRLQSILLFLLLAGAVITSTYYHIDSADQTNGRFERLAGRLDDLEAFAISLGGRIDSTDRHATEFFRISHERRVALAGELRREIIAGCDVLARKLEAEKAARGQLVSGERSARRREIQSAVKEAVAVTAFMAEDGDLQLAAAIDHIEKKIKVIESRPVPKPVVIEKTVQVPVILPAPAPVLFYVPVYPPRFCR